MVAKPKSAAAKKAAGEQKNKAAAAAAVATSLDGSSVSVVRRQLSRRDTEKQVERALQSSHFRHISAVSLANKVVDGKTIRQSLTDVLHNLDKGQRLGTSTYATLARKFSDGESCVGAARTLLALGFEPRTTLDAELCDRASKGDGGGGGGVKSTKQSKRPGLSNANGAASFGIRIK